MAFKNLQTVGDIWIGTLTENPSTANGGTGTAAPTGSLAVFGDSWYIKNAGADTNWAQVSEIAGAGVWELDGNALTQPRSIGATTDQAVSFIRNNVEFFKLNLNDISISKSIIPAIAGLDVGSQASPLTNSYSKAVRLINGGNLAGRIDVLGAALEVNSFANFPINIRTASQSTIASQSITIQTGPSTSANSGDVLLRTGSAGTTRGKVIVDAGELAMLAPSKLTNLADGVNPLDAVNKQQLDSVSAGLDPKESCKISTVADVAGAYNAAGGTGGTGAFTNIDTTNAGIFDGLTSDNGTVFDLAVGDRVLVKNQTDPKQNGIYVVTAASSAPATSDGAMERAPDHDGSPSAEVSAGNYTFVEGGLIHKNTGFSLKGNGILTLNTDPIEWITFSAIGTNFANQTLSNLIAPTAINQDLVADGNATRALGSAANHWTSIYANEMFGDYGRIFQGLTAASEQVYAMRAEDDVQDAATTRTRGVLLRSGNSDGTTSTLDSGRVIIKSGDVAGANKSGDIFIGTGSTTLPADRGIITLKARQINLGVQANISNVKDPVLNQDAATKKYVDDLIGAGAWQLGGNTFAGATTQIMGSLSNDSVSFIRNNLEYLLFDVADIKLKKSLLPVGLATNLGASGNVFPKGYINDIYMADSSLITSGGLVSLSSNDQTTLDSSSIEIKTGDVNLGTNVRGDLFISSNLIYKKLGRNNASPDYSSVEGGFSNLALTADGNAQLIDSMPLDPTKSYIMTFHVQGSDQGGPERAAYKRTLHVLGNGTVNSIYLESADFTSESVATPASWDLSFGINGITGDLEIRGKAPANIVVDWRVKLISDDLS